MGEILPLKFSLQYIYWSATILAIFHSVHATHEDPTTSTTTHVDLQTLGIVCGPLPSTLSRSTNFKYMLQSIGCFEGSIIDHLKCFFVISNGYSTEYHFVSWFVRYDHLKLHMFLHIAATRTTKFKQDPWTLHDVS